MNGTGWYGPWLGWGLAAALLLFWAVGAYNRLMRLRSRVLSIFGTLAQHLERYPQWVAEHAPEDAAAPPPRPGDPWQSLRAASVQFTASLAAARAKPLNVAAMAALSAARTVLQMAWQHLDDAALARASGVQDVPAQRAAWDAITAQTHSIGNALVGAAQAYNQAARQFPAVLLAWAFGFRPAYLP